MKSVWYIIFNPVSGGGKNKNRIENIKKLLILHQLPFDFASTEFPQHEELLIKTAITNGYRKFICIGGDGTLHHMVNGVMNQNQIPSHKISIAVIPIGTGNDWVKNYNISSHPEKAIQTINKKEKPLAAYYFGNRKQDKDLFLNSLYFGGGCINDTLIHNATKNLPFGGVGASGIGAYHGAKSFDCFSHQKGIVKRGTWVDVPIRYRAYESKLNLVKRLFKYFS